uniref:Uncharacterized protein n=1 Tax=Manihot esculenta TaxID=3983 RepID=A0A2C9VU48_MANES
MQGVVMGNEVIKSCDNLCSAHKSHRDARCSHGVQAQVGGPRQSYLERFSRQLFMNYSGANSTMIVFSLFY